MPNIKELETMLKDFNIDLTAPIVQDFEDQSRFYAFVAVKQIENNRQQPAEAKLRKISKAINQKGYNVEFILIDTEEGKHDRNLLDLLKRKFDSYVHHVVTAHTPGKGWSVWISAHTLTGNDVQTNIKTTILSYVNLYDLKLNAITFVNDVNRLPTTTTTLRVLRTIAPASLSELKDALEDRSFVIHDLATLNHQLDWMRKGGFIVRRQDGRYFLSLRGLSALGSSRDRDSLDVRRALKASR